MSWRFVAYEKFVFGSTLPAISIGPCIENPPCLPTIVWPPISMVGAPSPPSTRPKFSMKKASLPRPSCPFVKYRPFSKTTAFGSPSISTKMLSSGSSGRATNSVISSGGANFVSVSRGDPVYSNNPPSIRKARLSMSVLTGPSSLRLPIRPSGRAALGIWKPIMWNCSPKRFRRGGRVWQALHCRSYWGANAGTPSAGDTGAGAERLARAAMGGLVTAMLGMIVRVCRHGAGVDVYGERADVAEHNDHCHADEQPGRQAPDLHEAEPSERPAPCQVFRLSVLKLLVSDRQYPESLKAA